MSAQELAQLMKKHGLGQFTDREGREYFYSRRPHVEDIKIIACYSDQSVLVELYDEVSNGVVFCSYVDMDEIDEWLTKNWN